MLQFDPRAALYKRQLDSYFVIYCRSELLPNRSGCLEYVNFENQNYGF